MQQRRFQEWVEHTLDQVLRLVRTPSNISQSAWPDNVEKLLQRLIKQGEKLMTNVEALKAAADVLVTAVSDMKAQADRTEAGIADANDKMTVALDILKNRTNQDDPAIAEVTAKLTEATATLDAEKGELGAAADNLAGAAGALSEAGGTVEVSGGAV